MVFNINVWADFEHMTQNMLFSADWAKENGHLLIHSNENIACNMKYSVNYTYASNWGNYKLPVASRQFHKKCYGTLCFIPVYCKDDSLLAW